MRCIHLQKAAAYRAQTPWPGLPAGVKFDPSDQELLKHLAAKVGKCNPHPFLDMFICTLDTEDDICNTHPKKLPGIKDNGSSIHYFHRCTWAYATGKRKRRRKQEGEDNFVSWHKTGRTRSISEDGKQLGFKKIMVLYDTKAGKTNWVMHQYYLALQEEGKEEEYAVSKIFYQTQTKQLGGLGEEDNGEKEKSLLEEAEGPYYLVQQAETNETMMDISTSGEVLAPPVFGEMQLNLQNIVSINNETMVDVSSLGKVFISPSFEMQPNLQHQGSETNATMINMSSPEKRLASRVFGEMHPSLQHTGFESNKTMIDVSSRGEALTPPVFGEVQPNLQLRIQETRKGASSPGERLTPPAIGERQANTQYKGLLQQLIEDANTLWEKSFPQTVPAVDEQTNILLKQNATGIQHDDMHATDTQSELKDYLLSTQEAEDLVEGVIDQLSSMTESQKLSADGMKLTLLDGP